MRMISILIYFSFFSCSGDINHDLIRTWKVKNYTLWEKGVSYLKGVRGWETGHELTLYIDSTYREQTCGNSYVGKWKLHNDSLILNSDSIWSRQNYNPLRGTFYSSQSVFILKRGKIVKIDKDKSYMLLENGSKKMLDGYSMTILK